MATEISNGKQTVKLYRSVNRGKEMFQLAFYQAGRRVQKNFSDKAEAKRVAKQILGGLTNDAQAVEAMATPELESLVAARKVLVGGYPACVAFVLIGLLQLVVIAGLLVGPGVADQSTNLADALPKAHQQLLDQINGSPWGAHLLAGIQRAMDASKGSNWQNALKFAGLTIHGFGGLVFAVVIGMFLAFQPELYRTGFLNLFPKARRKRLGEVLDELGFTLWWWLMGQLVTMASVGTFIGIGLAILGVPLAGTLGLIAAILSFIPSLGPLISVIPAIMLGLTISPMMGVWVCLLYLGVQILEANVITPLVQRKAISLPPAFVLGSELLMGLLLGGAGLAFATPLVAVVLVLVNMLYIQDVLGERGSLPSQARREKRHAF